jgi:hypothetical protein
VGYPQAAVSLVIYKNANVIGAQGGLRQNRHGASKKGAPVQKLFSKHLFSLTKRAKTYGGDPYDRPSGCPKTAATKQEFYKKATGI